MADKHHANKSPVVQPEKRWPPRAFKDFGPWLNKFRLHAPVKSELLAGIVGYIERFHRKMEESKEHAIKLMEESHARAMAEKNEQIRILAKLYEKALEDIYVIRNTERMTLLLNRVGFTEKITSYIQHARHVTCVLGFIDVNRFKEINDAYGHATGDAVISSLTDIISSTIRTQEARGNSMMTDLHARLGGDEFAFFIPDIPEHDVTLAPIIIERLNHAIDEYHWQQVGVPDVYISVGVACMMIDENQLNGDDAKIVAAALCAEADRLMYRAKAASSSNQGLTNESRTERYILKGNVVAPGPPLLLNTEDDRRRIPDRRQHTED
ncbi:MAG: hypothetical protein A3G02_02275 [Candidatus Yanofskybacteria bacterium RIFCSPLOWO2_12_FULL_44_13b]|uniref:GGDEF domain-containing protein n=1 Tax=Candidatus Yanofskybacteria bacterium RIFCSPLOWO2_02_FULL_44_18 TaxID=1802705 RepID=A0A1F8H3B7_9BACT|nr:MAG: Diguanylate cyclase/phosphodiesterase [Candidatus Yanofskybacteria bacterium GW2011_GWA2_44_10]OGN02061.1 MAG: hypothetical protein A2657_01835 [Candidatus Yanofskybacteria bacterium RIFCSPHIGHO2_01_FULL_44_110b]OGN14396.1 MAG: hypothetical protein A3C01_02940 [Candidatus Yanofskybacteria bacterium RIFCSPHIGHO2_02_FULL_44_36b]OGN19002.1 MAG: hypothetical protein A3F50_00100 [Candidatus Yanofskybacteria bacterium RIFCSPHIGHO2_12_FULL_44_29b]OGN26482.1 MAG: hypothetical protein A3B12_0305